MNLHKNCESILGIKIYTENEIINILNELNNDIISMSNNTNKRVIPMDYLYPEKNGKGRHEDWSNYIEHKKNLKDSKISIYEKLKNISKSIIIRISIGKYYTLNEAIEIFYNIQNDMASNVMSFRNASFGITDTFKYLKSFGKYDTEIKIK